MRTWYVWRIQKKDCLHCFKHIFYRLQREDATKIYNEGLFFLIVLFMSSPSI